MRRLPIVLTVLGAHHLAIAASDEQPAQQRQADAPSEEERWSSNGGTGSAARELMDEAKERYRKGDLRGAIDVLKQCYALTHDARLHFNIAQVYRELGDCEAAVENYEDYVRLTPEGRRVADANNYIRDLGQRCKEKPSIAETAAPAELPKPAPASPVVRTTAATSVSASNNPWPWIAGVSLGASAISAVATTYFAVAAHRAKSDIEQTQSQLHFDAGYLGKRFDDYYRDRNWAIGMGIAFGATAGLGVCALAAAAHVNHEHLRDFSLTVTPLGSSIELRLHF